jgi:hypothetical protein
VKKHKHEWRRLTEDEIADGWCCTYCSMGRPSCLQAAVWVCTGSNDNGPCPTGDEDTRCAEHGPKSTPRPKRKPKPFARWEVANGWIFFDGNILTPGEVAETVAALNKRRVALKVKS